MKVLVISQAYPDENNPYQLMYVHNRNRYYSCLGDEVTVLSFQAKVDYEYEKIKVITEKSLKKINIDKFDAYIFHAPNLKNHLRFFIYNKKSLINKSVFFFHGHEILDYTKYYYGDMSQSGISFTRTIYEKLKISILRRFLNYYSDCLKLVFVSNWLKAQFDLNLRISADSFDSYVINNSIGCTFETKKWDAHRDKEYDFITIRPLSELKYAVDVVVDIAKENPEKKFLIIGKGNLFNFLSKPDNVTHIDSFVTPNEIPSLLDKSRCALMPTRLDAQGVMVCEMASYGMPVITSDIEVCKEMFNDFGNVCYLNNEEKILPNIPCGKPSTRFYEKETIAKEVDLLKRLGR